MGDVSDAANIFSKIFSDDQILSVLFPFRDERASCGKKESRRWPFTFLLTAESLPFNGLFPLLLAAFYFTVGNGLIYRLLQFVSRGLSDGSPQVVAYSRSECSPSSFCHSFSWLFALSV